MLCPDKRSQAAPSTFSKLAIAQLIGESVEGRHSIDRKFLKLRIRRIEMQRRLAGQAAADGLSQFEMIDAEQLQRFLNLRQQSTFELDSLRRDSIVDSAALGVKKEANGDAGDYEKQA